VRDSFQWEPDFSGTSFEFWVATMRCRENSQKCGGAASRGLYAVDTRTQESCRSVEAALAQGQKQEQKQEQPKILILRSFVC
jgi:hypothetical protein